MADSDTVVTDDLDEFSNLMFGKPALVKEDALDTKEDEEASEIETPSATEGNESDPEDDESEDEHQEDAPADEDEDDVEDEEEETPPPPKHRKSARERINELTRQAREAERRADALARELEDARQKPTKEDKPAAVPADAGAPGPDDIKEDGTLKYPLGEFDPLFIRDLTKHTIAIETAAARAEMEESRKRAEAESAEKALVTSWTEKLTEASKELPDLADKATELEDTFRDINPAYGQYLAATIMSLDYGPYVLDYLADHPDEAQKIVASGATQATIALGRLEATIAFEKKRNKVEKGTVTSAPPPPPKNKGSGGRAGVAPDTDDLDAFEKQFYAKTKR